jgi:hypothetical protein
VNSVALILRLTANPTTHAGEKHESATFRPSGAAWRTRASPSPAPARTRSGLAAGSAPGNGVDLTLLTGCRRGSADTT